MVRVHANCLMHDAGILVDAFAGTEQARTSLRDGSPDMVITGVPVQQAALGAFLDEARAALPCLRVVELVDNEDAFSFSVPGSNRPARVGRHGLEHTLVSAVAAELDAAWES